MSDKPLPPYLSLVSSFVAADYPYSFTNTLEDGADHIARAQSLSRLRAAATAARIKDYKLMEEANGHALYVREPADVGRIQVAMKPDEDVMAEFVQAEPDYDVRKLKRLCNALQNITDKEGFGNTILFELDRRERCIYFQSSSKKAYFDFGDFVEENRELFQPILNLQRKEPEFDLAFPADSEATAPKITYADDEYEENGLPETNPKSMGITIGGKTGDAEKSKDRSHLLLAKSFEPQMYGYNYKLTPNVVFDPSRSAADFLYQSNPDYPAFKLRTKTSWIMNQIRTAMKEAEVDDYYLSNDSGEIQAWFKEPQDLAVAYAAISPDMGYQVDYLHCSPSASPMKMSKKAKKLQEIFAETGEKVQVRFVPDKQRRVIQAVTDNTNDFIRVQGISRRLEKTHDKFQRLIGLK